MAGVWARGASQKIWDPLLFYATQNRFETSLPLKLATLNLVYNLGLGLSYQKQRLGPKLAEAWARGTFEKIWDPLFISETIEASD